jgi:predicted outer membrane repeat protein
VSISGVTIRNGHAGGALGPGSLNGGGIQQISGTTLRLTEAIVTGNDTGFNGGGIYTEGDITIVRSLITGNVNSDPGSGGDGGGIAIVGGDNKIVNSTISGNSADDKGGGLYMSIGFTLVSHTTFVGNSGPGNGGAIYLDLGTLSIRSNVFATSPTPNCFRAGGSLTSLGSNLSSDGSCNGHATDRINVSTLNPGPAGQQRWPDGHARAPREQRCHRRCPGKLY